MNCSLVVFGDYPHFKHSLMGTLEARCFRSMSAEFQVDVRLQMGLISGCARPIGSSPV